MILGKKEMSSDIVRNFKIIGLSMIVSFVISFITYFINRPFWFNENQLLYIFATIAQVTGGLFGLTLAAYTIIDDKLKKIGESEESSVDYTNQIRAENFNNLISISILSILSIIFSLLVISVYRNRHMEITIFFMMETVCLFVLLLIKIYAFIQGVNPNNIKIKKEKEKEQFDAEYPVSSGMTEKSFISFIIYYNTLEKTVKRLAQKQLSRIYYKANIGFVDALSILREHDIISQKCYAQINELRRYRNSLVHSTENNQIVNPTLFEILKNICNLLKALDNASNNDDTYSMAKKELDSYVASLRPNIDEQVLTFLMKHPGASFRDIAGSLNITYPILKRKIQKLIEYGYVRQTGTGRNTFYEPTDYSLKK